MEKEKRKLFFELASQKENLSAELSFSKPKA